MIPAAEIKNIHNEIVDLAIHLYGINLGGYSPEFLDRRLELLASRKGLNSAFHLKHEIINNANFAKELEMNISVNVTSMFRNPEFFKQLLNIIKIDYQPNDTLRIWHPGCSEGNEVYSLAILLHEAGLLSNTLLYGTDISHEALLIAKEASIRVEHLKIFSSDYRIAGGKSSLKDYFILSYQKAIINKAIRKHTCFSGHQLGSNSSIRKFQIVICRNMFIYYNSSYQTMLLNSLLESLDEGGLLCMGLYEPISHLKGAEKLVCIDNKFRIYRKL